MIVLHPGERLAVRTRILSRYGRGVLWVTDRAVACEIDGRGILLNFVPRDTVTSLAKLGRSPYGERLMLSWDEEGSACRFEFRTPDSAPLLSELQPDNTVS